MSLSSAQHETVERFWRERSTIAGPRAARFHGEHDTYDLAAIRACMEDRDPVRVLDLGCGTCVVASALVSELGWRVHAVDFIEQFLAEAIDDPRLTTAVGDVRSYEDAGGYDLVLSLGVITSLLTREERVAMYERSARMLAPGGVFFLKAQFGIDADVHVDAHSANLGSHYAAVYPQLDSEVAEIDRAVGSTAVLDPFPAELNPHPNTHFHYVIART